MRKEPLIAIVVGSIFGLAVAFGLWRFSKAKDNAPAQNTQTQNNTGGSTAQDPQDDGSIPTSFSILYPPELAVSGKSDIDITGKAVPGTFIVVASGSTSTAVADASGNFSVGTKLEGGINNITVWSIAKDKDPEKTTREVVYSSQIQNPDKKAAAMIGTVTDISEEAIQLRTNDGQIEQVGISPDTSYVSVVDTTKDIKFSDMAIGDYVAAFGMDDGKSLISADRVIVTKEPAGTNLDAIAGTIKTLSSKDFLVTTYGGKEVSIDATGGKATIYTLKDGELTKARLSTAKSPDPIIVVGTYKNDELGASTIILP